MKKFNFKSRKGFTLIELLVVIGILAVLAAIAIPSVAGLIDRANISSDDTNSNEMTNAIERFVSEYELYCQDIASGRIDFDDLDSAQSRVYNVTAIEERTHITQIENGGYKNRKLDKDTKYPDDYGTTVAIIQNYTKTSSSTFEPKQSDMHFWYSPDCGVVVYGEPESPASVLNTKIISGKDAKGKELTGATRWIDITTGEESEYVANYNSEQIANNPLLFGIGKTKPEYVLAEFNEDFTEVTIFKNGENSDGLIMGWSAATNGTKSPMREHDTTLKKAIYKEGVVNTGESAFASCENLIEVTLAESITDLSDWTFSCCENLPTINFPSKLKTLGWQSFTSCYKLNNITIPETATEWDGAIFSHCYALETINIPVGVKTLNGDTFRYCKKINNIIIPEGVETIGSYCFLGCTNLRNIQLANSIIKFESGAFESCTNLTQITLPESLINMGNRTFYGCSSIKELIVPGTTMSLGGNSYLNCSNLEKFVVLKGNTDEVRRFSLPPFGTLNKLTTISFPDDKIEISYHDVSATAYFKDASNWTSDEALYIDSVLIGCKSQSLTHFTVKEGTVSIARASFQSAPNVTSITIPASVKHIGSTGFNGAITTVYGESGSYAETWANEHGYTFVAQ